MSILEAVVLGIIQGLTEFLPVSSSGHLVLIQNFLGINEPALTFDVILHVGTLIPVFIVYRADIWELIKRPFQKMTLLLVVATIPAVVAALLFGDVVESLFNGGPLLAVGFYVTGVFLLYADSVDDGYKTTRDMTWLDALLIGCMQAIAITPAISRSGSTITGSLACKLKRTSAAKFSFLMSIPAIAGALVLEMKKLVGGGAVSNVKVIPMLFGFVAAALTGYLAITFMIRLIQKSRLRIFSIYVFALGTIILLAYFLM